MSKTTKQCPKCKSTKLIYGEDEIENLELKDDGTGHYWLDWRCANCKAKGFFKYKIELEEIIVDKK